MEDGNGKAIMWNKLGNNVNRKLGNIVKKFGNNEKQMKEKNL